MYNANEKFYLSPNMCPYVRDLIVRGIKFTPRRDGTQLKHLARFIEEPLLKIEAPEAEASTESRSQFSETFSAHSPCIRRSPAPSSGLSGKKPTPVSARTRFNSDAL